MTQSAALAALDGQIMACLYGAGLADVATYKASEIGSTPISDCSVYIDRSVVYQDTLSGVTSASITLVAFHADIGTALPRKNSTFTVGSEVFVVDRVIEGSDESRVIMLVTLRP